MAAQDTAVEYYVGLMSGTSIDGLDGVIIAISPADSADSANNALCFKTIATGTLDWPLELKNTLHQLCQQGSDAERVEPMYAAANGVATYEAQLVTQLLAKAQLPASEITAIGSHGQTIRHCPQQGFSVQIDNGPLLAHSTGIDAVVNLRAASRLWWQRCTFNPSIPPKDLCAPRSELLCAQSWWYSQCNGIGKRWRLAYSF